MMRRLESMKSFCGLGFGALARMGQCVLGLLSLGGVNRGKDG